MCAAVFSGTAARPGAGQTAARGADRRGERRGEQMSATTRNEADVIVIGGGIMGTTTAFFLRQRKRSVILLERGLTGQQASGVNFGGIRRQGRALPQLAMANPGLRTWQRPSELLGEDIEFLASGHTRVCYHQKDVENFDQYAIDARAY